MCNLTSCLCENSERRGTINRCKWTNASPHSSTPLPPSEAVKQAWLLCPRERERGGGALLKALWLLCCDKRQFIRQIFCLLIGCCFSSLCHAHFLPTVQSQPQTVVLNIQNLFENIFISIILSPLIVILNNMDTNHQSNYYWLWSNGWSAWQSHYNFTHWPSSFRRCVMDG